MNQYYNFVVSSLVFCDLVKKRTKIGKNEIGLTDRQSDKQILFYLTDIT